MAIIQPVPALPKLKEVLLWQHENAFNLQGLVAAKQAFLDANLTQFWTDWERDVYNLDTCNEFGCAVWAIILDLSLGANTPLRVPSTVFGFGGGRGNFDNSNFDANADGNTINLTINQRRILLKLRYGQLTTRCDIIGVNAMLHRVFGGDLRMLQTTDMSVITYQSSTALPTSMRNLILTYDLLPRPAGVGVQIITA